MDELGSGVLNVNKYLPVYVPGKKPQFIEGNSFNMIIPLDEKLIEEFDRVERYLKRLKEAGLIEFRGAPKSGGYYLIKMVKH